jgi:hypothetical protein
MNRGQVLSDFTDIIRNLIDENVRLNQAVINLSRRLDALESPERQRSDDGEHIYAVQWLEAYLAEHGVSKPADIVTSAEKASISKASVYRSRKQLGARIRDTHGRQDPGNCWELSEENNE